MRKFLALPFLPLLIFLTVSCSLMQPSRKDDALADLEVRDVPARARSESEESLRHRVLVLPFLASADANTSIAVLEEARRVMVRELTQTKRFVIVDNKDLPKDLKSYLNGEGDYDLESISKIASGMGISALIEGKLLSVQAKRLGDAVGVFRKVSAQVTSELRLRVVAARNGKEILNDIRQATADTSSTKFMERSYSDRDLGQDPALVRESLRRAAFASVEPIIRSVEKLSWEGRIALISGERVFINAGRLSGLQVGDILKVTEDGEEVYDPETGRFIGKAPGRMKGTIEVVSYFGKDGAIAVYHSGSGFKENDRIELY